MTRDDIVNATYDGALKLVELKAAYGLTDRRKAEEIIRHIRRAKDLIRRMEDSRKWTTPSGMKYSE